MHEKDNLVTIADIIEIKLRKEREVAFYKEQIALLTEKLEQTQQELDINVLILDLIKTESIISIPEKE